VRENEGEQEEEDPEKEIMGWTPTTRGAGMGTTPRRCGAWGEAGRIAQNQKDKDKR
jgi:hypothetical protein